MEDARRESCRGEEEEAARPALTLSRAIQIVVQQSERGERTESTIQRVQTTEDEWRREESAETKKRRGRKRVSGEGRRGRGDKEGE